MTHRPALIVIGPSASGKSTVVRELQQRGVVHVHPTWTTRPRRPDENAGALEHCFVREATFDSLAAAGFFIGTVTLPGLPYRYGLPHLTLNAFGPVDTIMARAPFLDRLDEFVPCDLVYQIEDTPERARLRLVARGCDEAEIAARLDAHTEEANAGRALARRVFRNDSTVTELANAVADALQTDLATAQRTEVRT